MNGATRPIQRDQSTILTRNLASSSEAISITATNYASIGSPYFSIQLPNSLSAHGGLTIQVNNINYIDSILTGTNSYTYNPAFNQPSWGKNKGRAVNPSFSGCWSSVALIPNGSSYWSSSGTICARYVRLFGGGLTAAGFVAYVWGAENSEGS